MFGIVIDKNGFKIDFFVLDSKGNPQGCELKDGEQVITISWDIANSMNKPQWNGKEWIDTDPLPPIIPEPPQPTETEVLRQELGQTNLYVTELELQNLQQQNEIDATNQFATELELQILELQMGGAV